LGHGWTCDRALAPVDRRGPLAFRVSVPPCLCGSFRQQRAVVTPPQREASRYIDSENAVKACATVWTQGRP